MLLYKQLDLFADARTQSGREAIGCSKFEAANLTVPPTPNRSGRDPALEAQARALLQSLGAGAVADRVEVHWSNRLRSAAGRADYRSMLITLNPRLAAHGADEIDRTFRHELAHLLAHARGGRRRLQPHGAEWRKACTDLGISGEARCHSLPFPVQRRRRPFLYRCPACAREFPRVRRIRRGLACLACCRRHNHGRYDKRFQLRLVANPEPL